ncbi:unnamed protein product, partial [Amoebophrya sp. A25]|eukprot:GSA25T00025449001.1
MQHDPRRGTAANVAGSASSGCAYNARGDYVCGTGLKAQQLVVQANGSPRSQRSSTLPELIDPRNPDRPASRLKPSFRNKVFCETDTHFSCAASATLNLAGKPRL